MADVILLVAQLELTSLRNVVRMLLTLGADEALGDKVQVVLNRVGSETRHQPEEGRGDDRQADLLADPQRRQADDRSRATHGVPLLQHAPRARSSRASPAWPQALCGKEPRPRRQGRSSRWGFSRGDEA